MSKANKIINPVLIGVIVLFGLLLVCFSFSTLATVGVNTISFKNFTENVFHGEEHNPITRFAQYPFSGFESYSNFDGLQKFIYFLIALVVGGSILLQGFLVIASIVFAIIGIVRKGEIGAGFFQLKVASILLSCAITGLLIISSFEQTKMGAYGIMSIMLAVALLVIYYLVVSCSRASNLARGLIINNQLSRAIMIVLLFCCVKEMFCKFVILELSMFAFLPMLLFVPLLIIIVGHGEHWDGIRTFERLLFSSVFLSYIIYTIYGIKRVQDFLRTESFITVTITLFCACIVYVISYNIFINTLIKNALSTGRVEDILKGRNLQYRSSYYWDVPTFQLKPCLEQLGYFGLCTVFVLGGGTAIMLVILFLKWLFGWTNMENIMGFGALIMMVAAFFGAIAICKHLIIELLASPDVFKSTSLTILYFPILAFGTWLSLYLYFVPDTQFDIKGLWFFMFFMVSVCMTIAALVMLVLVFIKKCGFCGLVGTLSESSETTSSHVERHFEKVPKKVWTERETAYIDGEEVIIETEYEEEAYVKDNGLYEHKRVTTDYQCEYCYHEVSKTRTIISRIGD